MPTPAEILNASTVIADRWIAVAAGWHVVFGIVIALICAAAITKRAVAAMLAVAMLSVSLMAWSAMNPVNGSVFALLAIVQGWFALRTRAVVASPPPIAWLVPAIAFAAFGWCYPHFLPDRNPWTYAYAAPLGLLPCPTLSMIAGVALIAGLIETRGRALLIGGAGLLYGLIGVIALGMTIDWMLIAAALTVLAAGFRMPRASNVRAAALARPAPGSAPGG